MSKQTRLFHDLLREFPGLANGTDEVNGGDLVEFLTYRIREMEDEKQPFSVCHVDDEICIVLDHVMATDADDAIAAAARIREENPEDLTDPVVFEGHIEALN